MRHFRVLVSCQSVDTSMLVCLDKDLEREQIHNICQACVKENYSVIISRIRVRHNEDRKWLTLEEMVQRLVNLRLYKIKYERVSVGMGKCHHGLAIDIPEYISPVHAIILPFANGLQQTVYINLKPKRDYLKVDYEAYAAELNRQDLKLSFRAYNDGVCADLPIDATELRVTIDCPVVVIDWKEPTVKHEMKQIKTEL